MKEKLKNIDFKRLFIVLLFTLLIGACVLVICLLNKYDENRSKTILNKNDDIISLNKDYYLDSNGNVVSNNLINPNNVSNSYQTFTYNNNIYTFSSSDGFNNYTAFIISNYETLKGQTITFSLGSVENIGGAQFRIGIYNGSDLLLPQVVSSNWSYTFVVPQDSSSLSFFCYTNWISTANYGSCNVSNIMCNIGSVALPYEPFGTWYNAQIISNSTNDNQNALLNYKDSKFYYNGSQIYSSSNLWTEYDSNTGFTYLELYDGQDFEHLDYIEVLYDTITIDNSLLYFLTNAVGPYAHIIFYNNNNSVLDLNYPYNSSSEMPFPIELYDSYTFNKIRVYNLIPSSSYASFGNRLYLSSSTSSYNYLLGYQIGYSRGIESSQVIQDEYNALNNSFNSLESSYNTLLEQYNVLLNSTEYSFSELFWSISAVPFGVLTSAFNVNVLGINLRGIITGLFTALLLIWIIKRLL